MEIAVRDEEASRRPSSAASPRSAAFLMLALSLAGLADAFYVAQASYTGSAMRCILFDGCNVVARSPHARVLGVPLSFLGVLFYACSASLSALLALHPLSRRLRGGALVLTAIGVGYSAFSVFLQVRFIHALCSYCVISAILTVLLLSSAWWHVGRTRTVASRG